MLLIVRVAISYFGFLFPCVPSSAAFGSLDMEAYESSHSLEISFLHNQADEVEDLCGVGLKSALSIVQY